MFCCGNCGSQSANPVTNQGLYDGLLPNQTPDEASTTSLEKKAVTNGKCTRKVVLLFSNSAVLCGLMVVQIFLVHYETNAILAENGWNLTTALQGWVDNTTDSSGNPIREPCKGPWDLPTTHLKAHELWSTRSCSILVLAGLNSVLCLVYYFVSCCPEPKDNDRNPSIGDGDGDSKAKKPCCCGSKSLCRFYCFRGDAFRWILIVTLDIVYQRYLVPLDLAILFSCLMLIMTDAIPRAELANNALLKKAIAWQWLAWLGVQAAYLLLMYSNEFLDKAIECQEIYLEHFMLRDLKSDIMIPTFLTMFFCAEPVFNSLWYDDNAMSFTIHESQFRRDD